MTMKKGLIYGSAMAILAVGLFISVNSASAFCSSCGGDTIVVTGGSTTVSTDVSVSSSQTSKSKNEVKINTNDHDKNSRKSVKRLPATGSDMLVMAGLAAFAFLVVFIGTKAPVKVK